MSGNRQVNGNRQRNFSVTSNTSASSFKDNSTINQQRISQQQQYGPELGVAQLSNVSESHRRRPVRSTAVTNNANSSIRDERNHQQQRAHLTNSSPRPSSLFDSINFDFSEDR